jgi:hypothetical protein
MTICPELPPADLWVITQPKRNSRYHRLSSTFPTRAVTPIGVGCGGATAALLLAERATLRLDPAAFTSDLGEHLAAVSDAARAQTLVERSRALGDAAACYRGNSCPASTTGGRLKSESGC